VLPKFLGKAATSPPFGKKKKKKKKQKTKAGQYRRERGEYILSLGRGKGLLLFGTTASFLEKFRQDLVT